MSKTGRIGVLMGGLSKEREISLRTGRAILKALQTLGYKNAVGVDVGHDVAQRLTEERIEAAVIALHGRFGEDGTIQGLLEFLKIPYTGSGVLGSALSMDKIVTKKIFDASGVKTPAWFEADASWDTQKLKSEVSTKLGFPAIAKPANEGSTIGLSIVQNEAEVEKAQKIALSADRNVLWEKFVRGPELTVSFVDNRPLPVIEIVPKGGFYDYEAKYTTGMTEYFCPARVSDDVARAVQDEAVKAFQVTKCESWGRVDVIFEEGTAWVLEVNAVPGMTETSLVPKAWVAAGGTFESLVEAIVQDASLKTHAEGTTR